MNKDVEGEPLHSTAADLVTYQDGGITSRTILKNPGGSMTVFAFDRGQSISEHTVPYDALVMVLDGEASIDVGSKPNRVCAGEILLLPAHVPHAVAAPGRFKMLLAMFKA